MFLDPDGGLSRRPTKPELERPAEFWDGFDQFGLFYDVFRGVAGNRVWFVGPKSIDLEKALERAQAIGDQSGKKTKLSFVRCWTACVAYADLPELDDSLTIHIDGQEISTPIGISFANRFADKRIAFCINHNNDLDWIADWAKFYHMEHGADAVVIFDNNSDAYDKADIAKALCDVKGIEVVNVVDWPFQFGTMDRVGQAHGGNPYVRFAQPVMYMSFYLRLAALAKSIVNVDVDELVLSLKGRSIFEFVEKRIFGCAKFERFLVENVAEAPIDSNFSFDSFVYRNRAKLGRQDQFKKWAMAPKKVWPKHMIALPNTHWLSGIWNPYPVAKDFRCYHFAGINTGWRAKTQKGERKEWQHERHIGEPLDPSKHVKDEFLERKLLEIFGARP